ncbi:MAG: diaminopimelate epimerase [Fimbriimonas sp.]
MQGIGNDFVMLDWVASSPPEVDLSLLSRQMNDRKFGVGGDGLIVTDQLSPELYRMRMFNPDGSESEMCGNGLRCVARLLADRHGLDGQVAVQTGAGTLTVVIQADKSVRVAMGKAMFTRGEIGMQGPAGEAYVERHLSRGYRGTAVSMGNPHLVIFVDDVASVPLAEHGPEFEERPDFLHRTNVHFVQRITEDHLRVRTWERGAGATLACGTGACACLAAAVETGRAARKSTLELPGGKLTVEYGQDREVFMTGPAETVFEGTWQA